MINEVYLMGRLTRDPEPFQTKKYVGCRIGLAGYVPSKNTDSVCFVDLTAWGKTAEQCAQSLKKGSQVLVKGSLRFERWEDNKGERKSRHTINVDRIVFINPPPAQKNEFYDENEPLINEPPF